MVACGRAGSHCGPGPGPAAERLPRRADMRADKAARRLRLEPGPAALRRPAQSEQGTLVSVLARRPACACTTPAAAPRAAAPPPAGWLHGGGGERGAGQQVRVLVRREAPGPAAAGQSRS